MLPPLRTGAHGAAEGGVSARQAAGAEAQVSAEDEAEAAGWAQIMSMQGLAEDAGVADKVVMCGLKLNERDDQLLPIGICTSAFDVKAIRSLLQHAPSA